VLARIEATQERIVVRNDLLEAQGPCVCGRVTVGNEDHVITEANGAPYRCIYAVLGHASTDHKSLDPGGRELRTQSRLEKRVAGAFVDDRLTG
jgi:hypothetical protein